MKDLLIALRVLGELAPSVNFKFASDRNDRIAGAVTCGERHHREVLVTAVAESWEECQYQLQEALRAYLKEEDNV
jgi:hypothetical protein